MKPTPFGIRAESGRIRCASIDTRYSTLRDATSRECAAAILCLVDGGYFSARTYVTYGAAMMRAPLRGEELIAC